MSRYILNSVRNQQFSKVIGPCHIPIGAMSSVPHLPPPQSVLALGSVSPFSFYPVVLQFLHPAPAPHHTHTLRVRSLGL